VKVVLDEKLGMSCKDCGMRAAVGDWLAITADRPKLTAALQQNVVRRGNAVLLAIRLENESEHRVPVLRYPEGNAVRTFSVSVLDHAGARLAQKTQLSMLEDLELSPKASYFQLLGPTQVLSDVLDLSLLFDLSKPGRYSVALQWYDVAGNGFAQLPPVPFEISN
jgi:hypothetical protein